MDPRLKTAITVDPRLKTARIFDARSGQTALEYLMMIVVAIIVITAILYWMNASSTAQTGVATQNENELLCRSVQCLSSDDCYSNSACSFFQDIECAQTQSIGISVISSNCQPSGVYYSNGAPITCTPEMLAGATCYMFNHAFNGGSVACKPGGRGFDLSGCYYEGTDTAYDKDYIEEHWSWPPWYVYTTSGDALCIRGWTFYTGQTIIIIGGAHAGTYTVVGFLMENGNPITSCPVLSTELVDPPDTEVDVTYRIPGGSDPVAEIPTCGNGKVETQVGEVCDGTNLNGKTCATIGRGYSGGDTLTCKSDCLDWITTGCYYHELTLKNSFDYMGGSQDIVSVNEAKIGCPTYRYNACAGKNMEFMSGPLAGQTMSIRAQWPVNQRATCGYIHSQMGPSCFAVNGLNICYPPYDYPPTPSPPSSVSACDEGAGWTIRLKD